jgi:rubrerythrin
MSALPETSSQTLSESSNTLGSAKGALRCGSCGYEIVSYRSLPECPMCRELRWEPAPWRPFTRHRP